MDLGQHHREQLHRVVTGVAAELHLVEIAACGSRLDCQRHDRLILAGLQAVQRGEEEDAGSLFASLTSGPERRRVVRLEMSLEEAVREAMGSGD